MKLYLYVVDLNAKYQTLMKKILLLLRCSFSVVNQMKNRSTYGSGNR
jgi:hypothetical protein